MNRRIAHAAQIGALVLALALVPAALAAKGGGGGKPTGGGGHHNPPTPTYTGTLGGPKMVVDNNGDGQPSYGDSITFNVTSNAPAYWVQADCSQNGVHVWSDTEGFSSGWLWGTTYVLGGLMWKSGAANCTAVLYTQNLDGSNYQQLAPTLYFTVNA